MNNLNQIDHIVVLMLENRSFDSMLGKLYPKSEKFDGLDGSEYNHAPLGAKIPVWGKTQFDNTAMSIPDPDPGELWTDMNMQLFGKETPPPPDAVPTMDGFVQNYMAQTAEWEKRLPQTPMHFYTPQQLPVLSLLAKRFAVCDRWHASAPCQTWPNRFFVHTGTANGYENNSPPHFPYDMPTIFNRFDEHNIQNGWKIYFHDMPQSLTLSKLWPHAERFCLFEQFRSDAAQGAGALPFYSFIEPRYFPDVMLPNDQHPPHNVTLGEQLIAEVYNCLRNGPAWKRTMLIITYDEHGGCYDHVPPPKAVPPAAVPTAPFNFDRYGVRVPAVIVSPYIPKGTILRPPSDVPFDHTSILATLRKRFSLGAPFSQRDAVAPDLGDVLSLETPDNLGPKRVGPLMYVPSPADIALARDIHPNGMQQALLALSHMLPNAQAAPRTGGETAMKETVALIKEHLGNFFKGGIQ